MRTNDHRYHQRRAEQERRTAAQSTDKNAAAIHARLAELHEAAGQQFSLPLESAGFSGSAFRFVA